MAKSIVAAWNKAPVQLLPSRSIARSIADEGVRITHRIERILAGLAMHSPNWADGERGRQKLYLCHCKKMKRSDVLGQIEHGKALALHH
jgi:hypothetical protein